MYSWSDGTIFLLLFIILCYKLFILLHCKLLYMYINMGYMINNASRRRHAIIRIWYKMWRIKHSHWILVVVNCIIKKDEEKIKKICILLLCTYIHVLPLLKKCVGLIRPIMIAVIKLTKNPHGPLQSASIFSNTCVATEHMAMGAVQIYYFVLISFQCSVSSSLWLCICKRCLLFVFSSYFSFVWTHILCWNHRISPSCYITLLQQHFHVFQGNLKFEILGSISMLFQIKMCWGILWNCYDEVWLILDQSPIFCIQYSLRLGVFIHDRCAYYQFVEIKDTLSTLIILLCRYTKSLSVHWYRKVSS